MKIIFFETHYRGEIKVNGEVQVIVGATQLEVMEKGLRILKGE